MGGPVSSLASLSDSALGDWPTGTRGVATSEFTPLCGSVGGVARPEFWLAVLTPAVGASVVMPLRGSIGMEKPYVAAMVARFTGSVGVMRPRASGSRVSRGAVRTSTEAESFGPGPWTVGARAAES